MNVSHQGIIPHSHSEHDHMGETDANRRTVIALNRGKTRIKGVEQKISCYCSAFPKARGWRVPAVRKMALRHFALNQQPSGVVAGGSVCAECLYHKNMTFDISSRRPALQATSRHAGRKQVA